MGIDSHQFEASVTIDNLAVSRPEIGSPPFLFSVSGGAQGTGFAWAWVFHMDTFSNAHVHQLDRGKAAAKRV
jgi:hypothetical protein